MYVCISNEAANGVVVQTASLQWIRQSVGQILIMMSKSSACN